MALTMKLLLVNGASFAGLEACPHPRQLRLVIRWPRALRGEPRAHLGRRVHTRVATHTRLQRLDGRTERISILDEVRVLCRTLGSQQIINEQVSVLEVWRIRRDRQHIVVTDRALPGDA